MVTQDKTIDESSWGSDLNRQKSLAAKRLDALVDDEVENQLRRPT